MIAGDFNTPFLPIDRPSRQKLNKELLELTDVINQIDLTDIYRAFYPNIKEHTFFSGAHELSPKLTTYLYTKQVSTDERKMKKYPTSYLTIRS